MRSGRIGSGAVVLVLLLLGTACGDDGGERALDAQTHCGTFLDRDEVDRAAAIEALAPADGVELVTVDEVCEAASGVELGDVVAAAEQGEPDAIAASVEAFCRHVEDYVADVDEVVQDLEGFDTDTMHRAGVDLINAAGRLPAVDDEADQARVEACTRQATDAALALVPGD